MDDLKAATKGCHHLRMRCSMQTIWTSKNAQQRAAAEDLPRERTGPDTQASSVMVLRHAA